MNDASIEEIVNEEVSYPVLDWIIEKGITYGVPLIATGSAINSYWHENTEAALVGLGVATFFSITGNTTMKTKNDKYLEPESTATSIADSTSMYKRFQID